MLQTLSTMNCLSICTKCKYGVDAGWCTDKRLRQNPLSGSAHGCVRSRCGQAWIVIGLETSVQPVYLFSDLLSELKIPLSLSLKPSALLKLADRTCWLFCLFAANSSSDSLTTLPPPPIQDQYLGFSAQIKCHSPRPVWYPPSGRTIPGTSTSCAIRAVCGSVFSTMLP